MFLKIGITPDKLKNCDLWQYFGYLSSAKILAMREDIMDGYIKRLTCLTFSNVMGKVKKCDQTSPEDYFAFEREIKKAYTGKDSDPLSEEGEYVKDPETGEMLWVYHWEGLLGVKKEIGKAGGR